jgi:multiple sugar transport system substrate-binding protein
MRLSKLLKMACLPAAAGGLLAMATAATAQPSVKPRATTVSFEVAIYSTKTVPFWTGVVHRFNAANPSIHVNLQTIEWNQAQQETVQQIAGHSLPDIVNTATIWLPQWVNSGALQPVTPSMLSSATRANFLPALYKVSSIYKGKQWGIPIAAATRVMFYNKKLFKKAGLNPNHPPSDWSQLLYYASQIKKKTGAYGYAYEVSDVQAFRAFGYLLWNDGGSFFTPSGKAGFDNAAGVKAMTFLKTVYDEHLTPNPIADNLIAEEPIFEAGKIGLMIDSSYFTANINTPGFSYGVEAVPVSAKGVKSVPWGVTDVLVVNKGVKSAAIKPFLDYLYQPQVQAQFDENEGFVPIEKSEAKLPAFNNATMREFVKMLSIARFDPQNPNYNQLQVLLKNAEQEVLLGQMTPAQALHNAAQQFNSLPG